MKKKNDYYRLDAILSKGAQYNMIYGKRSNGKSYAVKEECLKDFKENGNMFCVIRRYRSDITKALADLYFTDAPLESIFGDKFNVIYTRSGVVYLAKDTVNDKGVSVRSNETPCGYMRALSEAQRYSSTAYTSVTNIVLEEFISLDGTYLPNETMLFMHIISTICRNRDARVFMIANTISRLSPYWREFEVKNIDKQAQGTIDVYEMISEDGEVTTKVACEYCRDTAERSKLFFGETQKMTNEGKWLTNAQPHIDVSELEKANEVFSFVVKYNSNMFFCRYFTLDNGGEFIFVEPKTTPVKKETLVYTNEVTADPWYKKGFKAENQREAHLFSVMNTRCFFSDNLCGTEFKEAVRKILAS